MSIPITMAFLVACHCGGDVPEPPADRMVMIPGGTFMMGPVDADRDARHWERPRHQVTVSSFYMDIYEVTAEDYGRAVDAGVVDPPVSRLESAWQGELANWGRSDRDDHPINGVNWYMADSYCRWRGARLPTEAEFEYALRAGADEAIFPWGMTRTPPLRAGNYAGAESPPYFAHRRILLDYEDDHDSTSPVGSYPPNSFGLFDLSGNIWEWCSDWFDENLYTEEPRRDPQGPADGEAKILKGGGFHCVREELRIAERHWKRPDDGSIFSGFRCARDGRSPPDAEGR